MENKCKRCWQLPVDNEQKQLASVWDGYEATLAKLLQKKAVRNHSLRNQAFPTCEDKTSGMFELRNAFGANEQVSSGAQSFFSSSQLSLQRLLLCKYT